MLYHQTAEELERLKNGLFVAMSVPFIDDIEDYILEAIWEYSKGIDGIDPFYNIRSKKLYDVVDTKTNIGWSVKSLHWAFYSGCEYELVVQRADVVKKADELGFPGLTINSDPQEIGNALLKHWNQKINEDAIAQNVRSKRIMVLLKTGDKKKFAIVEEDIHQYTSDDLTWRWTNARHSGLQGIRKTDHFVVYRWYPSQKQFFERFILDPTTQMITIDPIRLKKDQAVDILLPYLQAHQ